ncbi:hypothetical protein BDA96_04G156000 [Sorghum bicolor]|uniref:Peptidase M16 middle/third domain-containing protein n=1 Tax=Sorghum bicolor TaxID=4558 RepID=A0A921UIQ8_SORBI|nr:hypothetical protein BDA96_04G156000 [Sorghum bicolor]
MSKTPAPALSASSSAPAAPFSVMTAGTYQGGEDPLVSKLGTQLGIIHPLPAPPVSRSVVGLFALFFLQAYVAKLETSMSAVASKLETKLYGYNDTLPILLSKIFSTHCSFSPTTDDFEVTFCGPKIVLLIGLSECKIKNDILLVLTLLFGVLSLFKFVDSCLIPGLLGRSYLRVS